MVSRSRRFPSPLNILRIWPRKSHNFALDSCRFYGMGLPMKRNSDHPGIPATWAAAPEDTGDCRFPSSPVALPPMRHGSRDCGTKPRCHPEPVERVALSPTSALNSSPSALPATRAPFVTSPRFTETGWICLDLPGFHSAFSPGTTPHPNPKRRAAAAPVFSPCHPFTLSPPHPQVGFTWIYLDSPALTQGDPRLPPPVPPFPRAHVSPEQVGFGWIYLDSPFLTQAFIQTPSRPSFPSFQTSILNLSVF